MHRITNHPVHLYNENGFLSPSAFIPFCQFGKNKTLLTEKRNKFRIPVCNSFRPKIYYNQLCYEININRFKNKHLFNEQNLKLGLSMLVDTNFNKQYSGLRDSKPHSDEDLGLYTIT